MEKKSESKKSLAQRTMVLGAMFSFLAAPRNMQQDHLQVETVSLNNSPGAQVNMLDESQLTTIDPTKNYFCTGGVNPKKMKVMEYLTAFARGPCHPIILIPGVPGTKLVAVIDCPVLKEREPETFKVCGWNSCEKGNKGTPKSEYLVWVPKVFSPMTIANSKKGVRCFLALTAPKPKYTYVEGEAKPRITITTSRPGVEIKVVGETQETKRYDQSRCGLDGVESFSPISTPFNPPILDGYRKLSKRMIEAGYLSGLTLQAIPYNFELFARENGISDKFEGIVDNMSDMVGKEVAVVAHSYGNFQAYHNLLLLKERNKEHKVLRYFAMAPPYLGTVTCAWRSWASTNKFFFDLGLLKLGATAEIARDAIAFSGGNYDLIPKTHFTKFKHADWVKAIKLRIKHENGEDIDKKNHKVFDIFPKPTERCFDEKYKSIRNTSCTTGLYEIHDLGEVNGDDVDVDNLGEIITKYGAYPFLGEIYEQKSTDNRFNEYKNTGVQTNIIYISLTKTHSKVYFDQDPKPRSKANKFYMPDRVETEAGDGALTSSSALTPGIKWALEFEEKVERSKPVNFVEMCSLYKRRESIFDDADNMEVRKNAYFGVDCNCEKGFFGWDEGYCGHGAFLNDKKLFKFLLSSLVSKKKGAVSGRFSEMTEAQLKSYWHQCDLFANK